MWTRRFYFEIASCILGAFCIIFFPGIPTGKFYLSVTMTIETRLTCSSIYNYSMVRSMSELHHSRPSKSSQSRESPTLTIRIVPLFEIARLKIPRHCG